MKFILQLFHFFSNSSKIPENVCKINYHMMSSLETSNGFQILGKRYDVHNKVTYIMTKL